MKKTILAIMAFVAYAFAASCDYDAKIAAFETKMGIADKMVGAKRVVMKDDGEDPVVIGRKSLPIKSGPFSGLVQIEKFVFEGCVLSYVLMDKQNPSTKEYSHRGAAHLRKDGSLKAVCTGELPMLTAKSPFDGTWAPNEDCKCYDDFGASRPFGKTGCLDSDDVQRLNESNAHSGGGILGDIMRNGTKVK